MPDPIERKRLKKKMLDRWENEGGRIGADSAVADDTKPTTSPESKGNKRSASRDKPRARRPASGANRRKAAGK